MLEILQELFAWIALGTAKCESSYDKRITQ